MPSLIFGAKESKMAKTAAAVIAIRIISYFEALFPKLKEPTYDDNLTYDQYLQMLPENIRPTQPDCVSPEVKQEVSKFPKFPKIPKFPNLREISLRKIIPPYVSICIIIGLGYASHSKNPNVRLAAAMGIGVFALTN